MTSTAWKAIYAGSDNILSNLSAHICRAAQVISCSTTDAETKQDSARKKEEQLQIDSANIAVEKAEAEAALEAAIPALEEAAAALNDLKRDEITEIRSFAKPATAVQKVRHCSAVGNG